MRWFVTNPWSALPRLPPARREGGTLLTIGREPSAQGRPILHATPHRSRSVCLSESNGRPNDLRIRQGAAYRPDAADGGALQEGPGRGLKQAE